MNTYYFINFSTDLKIIGHYPQVEHISHECHLSLSSPHSLKNIVSWKFPDKAPMLDYLILHKKAKLTDVLSFGMISAQGFLVSERFKEILEQLHLMPHKFYPAKIEYKGTFFNYFFLHLVSSSYDIIDFQKSKFYISDIGLSKVGDIKFENEENFLLKKKNLILNESKSIRAQKLYFRNEFENNPIDMFYFTGLHFEVFISQKIKSAIEVMEVTGLNIKNQDIIVS